MEEETSSRRGGVVVVLSVVSNSPKKEMLLSLFYSLLSLRQKRKTFFFSGFFCCSPRVHARRAGGDIAFWFLFNRTRRARAAGVAFFKTMDSGRSFLRFCLGFVSKKLGKKLCLTLSSHIHIRPRAHREKHRQKERKADEKQKTEDHTPRALCFSARLHSLFARVEHPHRARAFVDFLFFFLHPREKKNVFQSKKRVKNTK